MLLCVSNKVGIRSEKRKKKLC